MTNRKQRQARWLSREETSIQGEVRHIVRRAQELQASVVSLGRLVFFSTETGDAWMLDPEDRLALCLALDAVAQPVRITETGDSFGISWDSAYRIEKDMFMVFDASGRTRAIPGYPTREILEAEKRVRRG